MKKLFLLSAIGILIVFSLIARESNCKITNQSFGFNLPVNQKLAEVTFTLNANHIIIPALINGCGPFNLILDTGMPYEGVILFESAKTNKLKKSKLGDNGDFPDKVPVKIGSLELKEEQVMIFPSSDFEMEGIIGYSLFSRYVIKIDQDRNIISFFDPAEFREEETENKIPLTFKNKFPYVNASIEFLNGKKNQTELIVDIGAWHALSLNMGPNSEITPPEKTIPILVSLPGIGVELDAKAGRIKRLYLGKYKVDSLISTFLPKKLTPVDSDGNLGNGTLSKFNIIFDYSRECMYLEPNSRFKEPFEADMTGLKTRLKNKNYDILRVNPGSPAIEAGIKQGDKIVVINGANASEISENDLESLFKKEGETINLKIKRGSNVMKFTFKTRRLI
jgi:hypothetical protein